MKNFKIGLLILLLGGFTFSCKNTEEKPVEAEEVTATESHHSEDELRLNNGLKWQANPETTEGVLAMKEHLEAFRNLGLGDYNQLRTHLELEFKTILDKCTMKGEAHDQLHNYLYPMRDHFSNLSKEAETAEEAFLAIESYVPVYFEYFE